MEREEQGQKIEEIVDLIEVLLALGNELGQKAKDTLARLQAKREEKGGFAEGLLLVEVVSPPSPKAP
jgi:predicted house-cleaning noncanonical NTP pyrophosphatase (MazG superfamily)